MTELYFWKLMDENYVEGPDSLTVMERLIQRELVDLSTNFCHMTHLISISLPLEALRYVQKLVDIPFPLWDAIIQVKIRKFERTLPQQSYSHIFQ